MPQLARYAAPAQSKHAELEPEQPCLCNLQKLFADFLPGKVCVITGGGRGVGQAIAERYAAEGFTLILTARSKDQLEEVMLDHMLCYNCNSEQQHLVTSSASQNECCWMSKRCLR